MTNTQIAEQFLLLAQLMEIQGENPFKIKSYSNASDVIEELSRELSAISDDELYQIKGIGQAVGEKIRELQQTGNMQAVEKLVKATPPGIVEMLKVKGLSAKKIGTIWKSLEIETIDQLEEACNLNRLAPVKGFGAKSQGTILDALQFYKRSLSFYRYATARPFADQMIEHLQEAYPDNNISFTGDYRRQMEILEMIEIVADITEAQLAKAFTAVEEIAISDEIDQKALVQIHGKPSLLFHLADKKGFFNTLFQTTGSEVFLNAFLDKYTLPEHPASEEEIFEANDLAFVPAPMRETAEILDKAKKHQIPSLITYDDIKAVIHSHSTYSDGAETLEGMAKAAIAKGYEYLVISDHSQSAFYAKGLFPDRIITQHAEIDRLNKELKPFKIFKAIEADILTDGRLDYEDDVLASFDLVIASIHSNLRMTEEKAMKRLLTAIANPYTTILGHPTSRQLLIREGYPIDHKAVIDACVQHKVVIEINANPRRLDMDWHWISYALEQGALLSINPDAHSVKGIDDIYYGVLTAQKGGLTAKDNLSSFSLKEFEAYLDKKKQ